MTASVLKYIFILRLLLKMNMYLRIHFSDSTHASCLGLIVRLPSSHHNEIRQPQRVSSPYRYTASGATTE